MWLESLAEGQPENFHALRTTLWHSSLWKADFFLSEFGVTFPPCMTGTCKAPGPWGEQERLWPTPPSPDINSLRHSPPAGGCGPSGPKPQQQFLPDCGWPHQQPTDTDSYPAPRTLHVTLTSSLHIWPHTWHSCQSCCTYSEILYARPWACVLHTPSSSF